MNEAQSMRILDPLQIIEVDHRHCRREYFSYFFFVFARHERAKKKESKKAFSLPKSSIVLNFSDFLFLFFPVFCLLSFLDQNIDETGNQLYKSNHGPSECCYDYCKHDDGLCSSKCDVIFNINNETAIIADRNRLNTSKHHQNETKSDPLMSKTPNIFVKLDNGTYVLNDYSSMPDLKDMECPVLSNYTPSTQQCLISQAQVPVSSSATSFSHYYPTSYTTSSSVVSISILIQHLTTKYNNLMDNYYHYDDNNNNSNTTDSNSNRRYTYLHLKLVKINCIVAQLMSHWTSLMWNLLKVAALNILLLRLATGS